MNILYSVCLVPNREDTSYLDYIIASLAQKYGAFPFIPHLTVYGGISAPEKILKTAVNQSLLNIQQFSIEVKKLDYSDNFSKTLFIEFGANNSMQKIYDSLRLKLKIYKDYILTPHISLIYKNKLPDEEKRKIIKSFKIKPRLVINRCIIISANKHITKEEDVKDWKIVYDKIF